jgi:hypothetical protein
MTKHAGLRETWKYRHAILSFALRRESAECESLIRSVHRLLIGSSRVEGSTYAEE